VSAALAVIAGTRLPLDEPATQFLVVTLTLLGCAVLVALPGAAFVACIKPVSPASQFGVLLVGSSVVGLADFWAWVAAPTFGALLALVALALSLVTVSLKRPRELLDNPELTRPLLLGLTIALIYSGLAFDQGGVGGIQWTANGPLSGNTVLAVSYRF
jgi:hypothetical protein